MTDPYPGAPVSGPQAIAAGIIDAARRRITPQAPLLPAALMPKPERPALTDADRAALGDVIASGAACRLCAGVHPGAEVKPCAQCGHQDHRAAELSCPRLATFELDGDGNIKAGSFWPDGAYDMSRTVLVEEAKEAPAGEAGSDAG